MTTVATFYRTSPCLESLYMAGTDQELSHKCLHSMIPQSIQSPDVLTCVTLFEALAIYSQSTYSELESLVRAEGREGIISTRFGDASYRRPWNSTNRCEESSTGTGIQTDLCRRRWTSLRSSNSKAMVSSHWGQAR